MVPHFKQYLNYSQRNSNSELGLKLQTLKTGAESPFVKGSMAVVVAAVVVVVAVEVVVAVVAEVATGVGAG